MNIARKIKEQTDSILRAQKLNSTQGVTVSGDTGGGEGPTVNDWISALARHVLSGDHDGRYYTKTLLNSGQLDTRYYTEDEVDAMILEASRRFEPLTNGDIDNPDILFWNGEIIMQEVI